MGKAHDTEPFIAAARAIHGNRYDYSQTEWRGPRAPITVICRICGPRAVSTALGHLKSGYGCRQCNWKGWLRKTGQYHTCPRCRKWAINKDSRGYCETCAPSIPRPLGTHGVRYDTEMFLEVSRLAHGNRYDYSKTVYRGSGKPVEIGCRVHGEFTVERATWHSRGSGVGVGSKGHCQKCTETAKKRKETARAVDKIKCCKKCGGTFVAKAVERVYCRTCGPKALGKRKRSASRWYECGWCRAKIRRNKRQADKFPAVFCDIKCQQKWRAIRSNGGKRARVRLPVVRRCCCGKHATKGRELCPTETAVSREIRKALSRRRYFENKETWKARIGYRLQAMKKRRYSGDRRLARVRSGGGIPENLTRIKLARWKVSQCEWKRVIGNKLSNMRKRRKWREHVRSNSG